MRGTGEWSVWDTISEGISSTVQGARQMRGKGCEVLGLWGVRGTGYWGYEVLGYKVLLPSATVVT